MTPSRTIRVARVLFTLSITLDVWETLRPGGGPPWTRVLTALITVMSALAWAAIEYARWRLRQTIEARRRLVASIEHLRDETHQTPDGRRA